MALTVARLTLLLAIAAPLPASPVEFAWSNPVTGGPEWIRDAFILRVGDTWYLTGTSRLPGTDNDNPALWPGFFLWSSLDLRTWRSHGLILANADVKWAEARFWAPEIRWHPQRKKFYLCFNARQQAVTDRARQGMGLAVADQVTGPYHLLTPDAPITDNNDASLFFDDDGRDYVVQSAFALAEIDLDRPALLGGKRRILQGGAAGDWDDAAKINEGPCLLKINGTYTYFWSCNSWGYFVGYATATHVLGPYTKHPRNPIWGASKPSFRAAAGQPVDLPFNEVGHGTPFLGPDGRFWISGHGHWIGEKRPAPYDSPRLCLDPLDFDPATGEFRGRLSWTPQTLRYDPSSASARRAATEVFGSVIDRWPARQ